MTPLLKKKKDLKRRSLNKTLDDYEIQKNHNLSNSGMN